MKKLIYFGSFAAIICLQGCGDSMVKNKTEAEDQKTVVATDTVYTAATPPTTNNVAVMGEKSLLGYWVGWFRAPDNPNEEEPDDEFLPLANKITISIDGINGAEVKGHSVVAGNNRPFTGTVKKEGTVYTFALKEPGDDKYDGAFNFSITMGVTTLHGTWNAFGKVRIPKREYSLTKTIFLYNPNWKMEGDRYVDYKNKKKTKYKTTTGGTAEEETYFTTSADIEKYNASTEIITKEQAANLKKGDLFVLRNAIYARHGFSFKRPDLRMFFDQQEWYVPVNTDIKSELTDIEKKNIELLMRYEKNATAYYDRFGR